MKARTHEERRLAREIRRMTSDRATIETGSRWVRAASRVLLAIAVIATLLITGRASAAVVHVDDSAPAGGDGQSWATAYRHLQDGLAAAGALGSDVTEIRIGPGTHRPDESQANPSGSGDRNATFTLVDGVIVRGGFAGFGAPDPDAYDPNAFASVLSGDLLGDDGLNFANVADNSIHVVTALDVNADLRGCVVRGGNANGPLLGAFGGGVWSRFGTLHLTDCRFEANTANTGGGIAALDSAGAALRNVSVAENRSVFSFGGGVYIQSPDARIILCTFQDNLALGQGGGGLYLVGLRTLLEDCRFIGNQCSIDGGGGARVFGHVTARRCEFLQNTASGDGGGLCTQSGSAVITHCTFTANSSGQIGGGLSAQNNPTLIAHCEFEDNQSEQGGGLHAGSSADGRIQDCAFRNNSALERGGGLGLGGTNWLVADSLFETNAVTMPNNMGGGGGFTGSDTVLRNCRFLDNSSASGGGGFSGTNGDLTISGCVFSGNTAAASGGGIGVYDPDLGSILNCSIVNNSAGVSGGGMNISSINPKLGFEINNSIFWANQDANGGVQSSQLSISGAVPAVQYSCLQNLTGNLGPGNVSSDPQFADADGADNVVGTIDDDLRLLASSPLIDAGGNFFFRFCSLDLDGGERKTDDPAVPDTGGGGPPLPDMGAYERLAIVHDDCDANAIDDECDLVTFPNSDCDGSGTLDVCEINAGVTPDCDFNGRPDSCDFVSGSALDCNANGVPDSCDIAAGVSVDCNGNCMPDS
jgi:hypothetical protein